MGAKQCTGIRVSLADAVNLEYKICSGVLSTEKEVKFDRDTFEIVERFCYLGYIFSRNGSVQVTCRTRARCSKFKADI